MKPCMYTGAHDTVESPAMFFSYAISLTSCIVVTLVGLASVCDLMGRTYVKCLQMGSVECVVVSCHWSACLVYSGWMERIHFKSLQMGWVVGTDCW